MENIHQNMRYTGKYLPFIIKKVILMEKIRIFI